MHFIGKPSLWWWAGLGRGKAVLARPCAVRHGADDACRPPSSCLPQMCDVLLCRLRVDLRISSLQVQRQGWIINRQA